MVLDFLKDMWYIDRMNKVTQKFSDDYAKYYTWARRFINMDYMEDSLHSAFLSLLEKNIDDNVINIDSYIKKTIMNTFRNLYRNSKSCKLHEYDVISDENGGSHSHTPDMMLGLKDFEVELIYIGETLSPKANEYFFGYMMSDAPNLRIYAKDIGKDYNTVKLTVHRANKIFNKGLKDYGIKFDVTPTYNKEKKDDETSEISV